MSVAQTTRQMLKKFRTRRNDKTSPPKPSAFETKYILSKTVLGTGSFGQVKLGYLRGNPTQEVAVKIMMKSKLKEQDRAKLSKEVAIMKTLNHPNIVKFLDFYDEEEQFIIVMEYIPGGELYKKLIREGYKFNELECRDIIYTLVNTLKYCLSKGVVHRDIKPQNILLGKNSEIKLIDFNLSRQIDVDMIEFNLLQSRCGTPHYVAPEVLDGAETAYNYKCDIWSVGVVAYILLSGGVNPFEADRNHTVLQKVRAGKWRFSHEDWIGISDPAKDLVSKMLVKNVDIRLTYDQILGHKWFKTCNETELMNSFIDTKELSKSERHRIETRAKVNEAATKFAEQMDADFESEEDFNFDENMNSLWQSNKPYHS